MPKNRMLLAAALAFVVLLPVACGDPPPRHRDDDDDWARGARDGSTGQGLNVRVDVQAYEVDDRDAEGWSLFWGASVPIGSGRLSINGLRAGTGGAAFFARMDVWKKRSSVKRKTESFLVTADGHPASLEVGERRAEPVTIVYLDNGEVINTWRWTGAGALLEVTPRRNGDGTVTVKVHPLVSHREGAGRTQFAELDTEVTVKEGDAVVIGGNKTEQETFGSTLFSKWESGRQYRLVFVLRARGW
ncbi:MAG: type II and III secretion system protein [Planctomycetes bacterium]|nr:type II and III secretion system protein [Planctomycetota bacterium]